MVPDFDPQPGDTIGRYVVQRHLGRGGMAAVYAVVDPRDGQSYALKLLLSPRPEVAERFDSEFQTLANLDHPHVIRVFEQGEHGGRRFFVMEHLEGQDLRDEVEGWRGLPPAERFRLAERVLVRVAQALAYVHDQGLIHRDVTPGNIMVLADGDVRLMDFGVVKAPGGELTAVGEMIGTVAYASPEQLHGQPIDARADLYALGSVLYLMLTGRRPFNASTLGGYVDKHLNTTPSPPRETVPTVPEALNDACLRLLKKDPEARFGSAHHLLAALGHGPSVEQDLRRWPHRPVGRVAELARMRSSVAELSAGRGGLIALTGDEGSGRTQLFQELARWSRQAEIPVDHFIGTSGPNAILRQLLRDLTPAGATPPAVLLEAVRGGKVEPYAVHSAIRDLLRAALPRVVIFDDLHSAARGTRELMHFLARNLLVLEDAKVLFAFSWVGDGDLLEGLFPALQGRRATSTRLKLPPIPPSAVEELLLLLLPLDERTQQLAARLHALGEGNPYLIGEMIRGLIDEGAIAPSEDGYALTIEDVEGARLPMPASIREALDEQMARLSPSAREVASLVSLFEHEITIDVLQEALGWDEDDLLDAVEELLDAGVLERRVIGTEEVVELIQSRLGERLRDNLPPSRRQAMHARAGLALEQLYRHRLESVVESLAYHFEQGGRAAKACAYLFRAGTRLMERSFMPEAIAAFDRALAFEPEARGYMPLDEADRRLTELRLARGQALQHMGDWEGASKDLKTAAQLARELDYERLRCRAIARLGDLSIRESRFSEAERLFAEALALADHLGDGRLRLGPLYGMGQSRWNQRDLEGARHYWLEALAVAGALQDDRALGQAYRGMGLVAVCRGQSAEARRFLEQSCQRFERLGLTGEVAISRVNLVEFYHFTGNFRKGLKLADRTIAQAREVYHLQGIALGLHYRALILVDLGRLQEAEDNAREALQIIMDIFSGEDEFSSYVYLARIALAQQAWGVAAMHLDRLKSMEEAYDTEGYAPVLLGWRAMVQAASGAELEEVHATLAEARSRAKDLWPHQQTRLELISARALGAAGSREEARVCAEAALEISDRCGYRFYAMKAHLLLTELADEEQAEQHRQVARRLSRSLVAGLSREDAESFQGFFPV